MSHAVTASGLLVPTTFRRKPSGHDGNIAASAGRIDLAAEDQVRKARAGSLSWQEEAWTYHDNVPEVGFAAQFKGAAMSRLRFYAGVVVEPDEPPVPIADAVGTGGITAELAAAAEAEVARLGGPDEMAEHLHTWGQVLTVSGDSYLVGRMVDEVETWAVYSESVLVRDPDKPDSIGLRFEPGGKVQPLDTDTDAIIRVWNPHPRWPALAHSSMRSILGECEELLIYGRQFRAVGKSRNPSGILFVANELGDAPQPDGKPTPWEVALAKSMTAPTLEDGSPSSLVPHIIRGPAVVGMGAKAVPAKDALFHLALDRKIDEKAIERVAFLIQRAAHGLDVPVEVLTGVADVNHWTAWQIEDTTYKAHVEPMAQIPATAVTRGLLRPALQMREVAPEVLRRIVVGIDPSALVVRPNRAEDAMHAYDRWAISWPALRKYLGFTEADAPDDDEVVRRLVVQRGTGTQAISVTQLDQAGLTPAEDVAEVAGEIAEATHVEDGTEASTSPAGDAPEAGQDQPTPEPQRPAASVPTVSMRVLARNNPLAAAVLNQADSTDEDRQRVLALTAASVQAQLGERLAGIDRTALEALTTAAGDTVTNALRIVGNKLRGRAQGDPDQAEAVRGADPEAVAGILAGMGAASLADIEALAAEQVDSLRPRYDRWVAASYDDTAAAVDAVAGDDDIAAEANDQLRAEQDDDTNAGWLVLAAALVALIRERALTPDATPDDGEYDATMAVPRGPARMALARAGGILNPGFAPSAVAGALGPGLTVGGIATGPRAVLALRTAGYSVSRWVWQTGRPSRPFPPHQRLQGTTFSDWGDPELTNGSSWPPFSTYFPGDHHGCQCYAQPVVSTIEEG